MDWLVRLRRYFLLLISLNSMVFNYCSLLIGCIKSFSINERQMDFSSTLLNASNIQPGCALSSSSAKLLTTASNSKQVNYFSQTKSNQATETAVVRVTVNIGDCRSSESVCLNGGVCVPEYALPGNSQNRQWASSPSRHVCRCPSGFEGARCESS